MVNGWVQKPLLDCVELLQGLTYSSVNIKPYGMLVLRSSNIQNGILAFDDCVFVDCEVDEKKHVRKNDILICVRNGSKALIGKSCVIDKDYEATFGAFMSVLRGDKTGFYAYMFESNIVQTQIRNRSSATINQITKRDFQNIIIPVPSDPNEQCAIAAALSDMGAYITTLEKLIAKKQLVKQGTMQELLTGKRRLPGFSGEWNIKKLEDLNIRKGQTITQSQIQLGDIPVVAGGKSAAYYHNRYNREANTITISASGASAGFVNFWKTRIFASDCSTIEESSKYNVLFVYYWLLNKQSAIYELQTGGAQPHVQPYNLVQMEIKLPDCTEQAAIAEVLSDMDAEIDALTAKLNKAKHIKQGMMSELLTGRIRLIDTEPNRSVRKTEEQPTAKGHNQQFDDAVMMAGIVNVLYHEKYPLGRKKVQKCLYLLRRYQNENTEAFKKKAAGPYADEVRYKGGEPIAKKSGYINTKTSKQGTIFACGKNISQALGYIETWGRQDDIKWVSDNLRFKRVDELELLATVDMASCDLTNDGIPVTVQSIKHLIENNKEWKAKLEKQIFCDANIDRAIRELQTLLKGGK